MEKADTSSIRCGICSYECVKYRKLRRHYKKTHPECDLLCCPLCDFVTHDQKEMRKHKKAEHKQDRLGCSCCEFSTRNWRKWRHHEETAHQSIVTQDEPLPLQTIEHYDHNHDVSCSSLDKSHNKNMSGQQVKCINSHGGDDLLDSTADKEMTFNSNHESLSSVSFQQMVHPDIKRLYSCELCHQRFTAKNSVKNHQKVHSGIRPYHCQYCDYTAAMKSTLVQHLRIHSGSKPYQCQLCDYSCAYRSNLLYHMVTHSDDRPFPCTFCHKRFKRKDHVQAHIRTRHNNE